MIEAQSFLFAVGDYLVTDGQGGGLRIVHGIGGPEDRALVAITASTPAHAITLLMKPDEATLAACNLCTMAHALRTAA